MVVYIDSACRRGRSKRAVSSKPGLNLLKSKEIGPLAGPMAALHEEAALTEQNSCHAHAMTGKWNKEGEVP